MIERILIVLWSAALAFICIALLGKTHILSSIFGIDHIAFVIDTLFFVLAIIFAVILSLIVPHKMSRRAKIIGFSPIVLIVVLMALGI